MEKLVWIVMIGIALAASFVPLEPFALSLVVFALFVFVSMALFQQFSKDGHWLDRYPPLVGVGLGIVSLIAYIGLFIAWVNASGDSQVWRVIPQLIFVYVGIYLFTVTMASFLAGATRERPSRFFRPILIFSVVFYAAMLLLPFQPGL
ncbi:hypothetical protein [Exiguobacterium aurantiacum]|uniref:hypothetical protein n=1 Tax=Exiguobacterium aurantiacum TaxID=33987 RepID=UPI000A6DC77A|nr:hypothetical protein [Exiguobacterium aurantiacum]